MKYCGKPQSNYNMLNVLKAVKWSLYLGLIPRRLYIRIFSFKENNRELSLIEIMK